MRKVTATALGCTAAYLVSQTFIGRRLGPVAGDALRLQTTTSAEKFRRILDGWDSAELARYRSHLPPDMVHPLIYGASLTSSAVLLDELTPMPRWLRRTLVVAPWCSALGDYGENIAHWYLLDHRESITPAAIRVTGTVTNTKWALAGACVVTLAAGYTRAAWRGIRARRTA